MTLPEREVIALPHGLSAELELREPPEFDVCRPARRCRYHCDMRDECERVYPAPRAAS